MSVELLEDVHPDVRYERVPLDDEHNAHPLWKQAVALLVDVKAINDACHEYLYRECVDGQCDALPPKPFPRGEDARPLLDLFARNQPALDLIEAGFARGRLQLPEASGIDSWDEICCSGSVSVGLRPAARLYLLRAAYYAAEGEFDAAYDAVESILRLSEMFLHADGVIVTFLLAIAFHGMGIDAAQRLTAAPEIPPRILRKLLAALNRDPRFRQSYADCARADFCCIHLHQLDQLPEDNDVPAIVDAMLKTFYFYQSHSGDECNSNAADGRIETRRRRILQVLAGHPRPLDKRATIEKASSDAARAIASIPKPWRKRRHLPWRLAHFWRRVTWRFRPLHEVWPFQLSPGATCEFLSVADEVPAIVAECYSPADADYANWLPPSDRLLMKLRQKCMRVENPIGEILRPSLNCSIHPTLAPLSEGRRDGARVITALRVFEREHNRLPDKLDELVSAGLMAEVPVDPFSGRPFLYNASEKVVWCAEGFEGLFGGQQLIWRL